jgi:hypothetical protein
MLVVIRRNSETCARYDDDCQQLKKILECPCRDVYTLYVAKKSRASCYRPKARSTWYGRILTSGTNVDRHPQSCTQEKCQNYGSPRVVAKATKISSTKACAAYVAAFHQNQAERHNDVRKEHIVNERTTEGGSDLASVSSTKTIEIVAETCNTISGRRSNESKSTCQYMGWNTDLCRFW